ncbi:hypothetical protein [Streptomyces sp. G45]|uniref:hypothetical protein n=1 Tax=Streptomyces sp. G45 TaxID=3406627 RepID=UPI003C263202
MNPTIVLLTPLGDHQKLVGRLRKAGSYAEGEIFDRLHRGPCSFGVDLSGSVLAEFDEDEVEKITEELGEFRAVLLEYREVSCIRTLLEDVLQGLVGLLDTNFDEVLPYAHVLARFGRDPEWDWRVPGH